MHVRVRFTFEGPSYAYWVDGRKRPSVGDRVRVPTHDGESERVGEIVAVNTEPYEGPVDEVIEIIGPVQWTVGEGVHRSFNYLVQAQFPVSFEWSHGWNASSVSDLVL